MQNTNRKNNNGTNTDLQDHKSDARAEGEWLFENKRIFHTKSHQPEKRSGKRAGKRKVCLPELHSAGWRCAQDHDMRDRGLRADPSGGTAAGYRI